ncbi:hypothetical protein BaRGS_00011600 [Batillaria attramentaria]|uniref:Uncharacterized protein n=1 Tax=Batillaria attramentaria TaxID=370345 RepID=A0ABD0LCG6_9CAEN
MGNNVVYVRNNSKKKLTCISFNNSDCVYIYYRELIQVPTGEEAAHLDGLPGGRAVQVGVVYDVNQFTGHLIYDLFQVYHGATITITDFDDKMGVKNIKDVTGKKVRLLAVGRSIWTSSDHLAGVQATISGVGGVAGSASQSFAFVKTVAADVTGMATAAARNRPSTPTDGSAKATS